MNHDEALRTLQQANGWISWDSEAGLPSLDLHEGKFGIAVDGVYTKEELQAMIFFIDEAEAKAKTP